MVTVKYEDLEMAFDFVSSNGPMDNQAFISLDTGRIYWLSDDNVDEDMPEDIEESDRHLPIPDKNDLDLGRQLALRFAEEQLPDRYDTISGFFRHRGAYARFKELLTAAGRLDDWYRYETKATHEALKEWCAEHDIRIAESVDVS